MCVCVCVCVDLYVHVFLSVDGKSFIVPVSQSRQLMFEANQSQCCTGHPKSLSLFSRPIAENFCHWFFFLKVPFRPSWTLVAQTTFVCACAWLSRKFSCRPIQFENWDGLGCLTLYATTAAVVVLSGVCLRAPDYELPCHSMPSLQKKKNNNNNKQTNKTKQNKTKKSKTELFWVNLTCSSLTDTYTMIQT